MVLQNTFLYGKKIKDRTTVCIFTVQPSGEQIKTGAAYPKRNKPERENSYVWGVNTREHPPFWLNFPVQKWKRLTKIYSNLVLPKYLGLFKRMESQGHWAWRDWGYIWVPWLDLGY
jgi:hypothetical protein